MELITQEYLAQNQELHRNDPEWGSSGKNSAPVVESLIQEYQPLGVLDYGCGKQTLARELPKYRIVGYDPAIPGCESMPEPADLVICVDVMEHIESHLVDDVLDDLRRVTKKVLLLMITVLPAMAMLPDGRNAHLTIKTFEEWLPKIMERFEIINISNAEFGFQAIVGAKNLNA